MSGSVVIIGAGIVGAACARALSGAAMNVTVLERGSTASATSAMCEGNLLVSDKGPGLELQLAQYAASLWSRTVADLIAELGPDFPPLEYERKGGLVAATTAEGAQPLLDFAARQRSAGVDAHELTRDQTHRLEPELTPHVTAAVLYPEDSQVQPVIATEALLASARRRGASVRTGVTVTGGVHDSGGRLVGVSTSGGDIHADHIVNAAGPWSGDVARVLGVGLPVRPRRGNVLVTTRMAHRVFHKVYDGDYVGATQSADVGLQTSSVVETTAAGTVLIGSSREQCGFDDSLRITPLREIAAKAIRLFPFLATASVMRSYGGFRPYMPDHLPVIGQDHRMPGLWHATGHEGAGIGLSLATAELLRAGITDCEVEASFPIDIASFAVNRASLAPYLAEAA